jgi:hypothetical protein
MRLLSVMSAQCVVKKKKTREGYHPGHINKKSKAKEWCPHRVFLFQLIAYTDRQCLPNAVGFRHVPCIMKSQ